MIFIVLTTLLFAGGSQEGGVEKEESGQMQAVESETKSGQTITVTDKKGVEVVIEQPVERIVSINSGLSEIIAALECAERMVGRCSYSTFPSSVRSVFVVGKNSSSPNMERIFELEPDLVLADAMFDESKREILNGRGIPVLIESTSDPDTLPDLVRKLGRIVQKEERAEEIVEIVEDAMAEIQAAIESAQKAGAENPVVFFENRKPYKSASAKTGHHRFIELAGGINIAEDEPVRSPELNAEYIVQRNPDIIIRRVSGDWGDEALEKMLQSIYERPSIKSINAIQNNNVYIIKSDLFLSLRYPAGVSYFAHWFYPDALDNLGPAKIHERIVTELYGREEWEQLLETYVYP